jgi:c(7)-type cytochrome triheme protein
MFTALEEHFSRMFLQNGSPAMRLPERRRPGGEQTVMTQDEQRRALEWTQRQSLQAAHELLEKRVCVECHTVSAAPGVGGYERWRVEPVKLASSWMPRAQFNHAAHRSSTCVTCHDKADASRSSTDVLMPQIKQCQACHGGSHDVKRLASDCTMCHRLHLPGRGDLVVESPAEHAAGPSIAATSGVPQ